MIRAVILYLVVSNLISCSSGPSNNDNVHLREKGQPAPNRDERQILVPYLEKAPTIDGNLDDWKEFAFTDGLWDIYRVRTSSWYEPARNRLTSHGDKDFLWDDLGARYYMAWDSTYLYLGAEVFDNINDVNDPEHENKRWYYKDCVCWFIEAPADTIPERFGRGDNAFCFIADAAMPAYGAWWRHGDAHTSYIEERLPQNAVDFRLKMDSSGRQPGSYVIEARVKMSETFRVSDPSWTSPKVGDRYGVEIVHTDPDGGDYGGHLMMYGKGDEDETWSTMVLTEAVSPLVRKTN